MANLDQILCIASLGVGKGCILFWGRLDQHSDVHGNKKPPLTRSSSILGWVRQLILEYFALGWQKFHTFELEYLWSQLADLDQILCVASFGWGKGCIRFWGRWMKTLVSMATKSPHWFIMGKMMCPFLACFYLILFILAGNEDMHKISVEFEFGQIGPLITERSKTFPIDL